MNFFVFPKSHYVQTSVTQFHLTFVLVDVIKIYMKGL